MSRELGSVTVLGANAVGQPGQRRFRLFTRNNRKSAIMWMEKEQLSNLAEALDRSLALISEGQILRTEAQAGGFSTPGYIPTDFPKNPTYEFQVGRMNLDFDERTASFHLHIVPLEVTLEAGEEPQVFMREEDTVSFVFSQQQARTLSHSIMSVISAGRPVCPLCHTPLDGGPHACVKQNGHREIVQIEGSNDDE